MEGHHVFTSGIYLPSTKSSDECISQCDESVSLFLTCKNHLGILK
jgi:hypothetical protein